MNAADYRNKSIFLVTPLAGSSRLLINQRQLFLTTVLQNLLKLGLNITTSASGTSASILMGRCNEAWVLLQSCDPRDIQFFEEMDVIRNATSKPYSLLTYPDLSLEPIRRQSSLLNQAQRKLVL